MENISDWPVSNRVKNALMRAGIVSVMGLPEYLEDLKAIDGLGPGGVKDIREWAYQKFRIKFKSRPKEKKKVLKNFKEARQVLEHLIPGPKNWAQQLKLAEILLDKYGLELILKVKPNPKVFSLKWFVSEWGDKYIREFMSGKVVVDEVKEDEHFPPCDLEIKAEKPKTLRDFLKL